MLRVERGAAGDDQDAVGLALDRVGVGEEELRGVQVGDAQRDLAAITIGSGGKLLACARIKEGLARAIGQTPRGLQRDVAGLCIADAPGGVGLGRLQEGRRRRRCFTALRPRDARQGQACADDQSRSTGARHRLSFGACRRRDRCAAWAARRLKTSSETANERRVGGEIHG